MKLSKYLQNDRIIRHSRKPVGYWNNVAHQREFFQKLEAKWNIKSQNDWYQVKLTNVLKEGGYFINSIYNGSLLQGKK
jgi:hypothetical protein